MYVRQVTNDFDLTDTLEMADQGRDRLQHFTDCKPNYNSEKSKQKSSNCYRSPIYSYYASLLSF
jgi:hypothetical protein